MTAIDKKSAKSTRFDKTVSGQKPKWLQLRDESYLIRDIELPLELAAAVQTGRTQLLEPTRQRIIGTTANGNLSALSQTAEHLLNLVAVLMETNQALREHAAFVEHRLDDLCGNLGGVHRMAERLKDIANFRDPDEEIGDED